MSQDLHSLFEVIMIVSMDVGVADSGLTGYEMIQNTCQDEEVMMVPSVSVDRKMSGNRNFQHAILNKG